MQVGRQCYTHIVIYVYYIYLYRKTEVFLHYATYYYTNSFHQRKKINGMVCVCVYMFLKGRSKFSADLSLIIFLVRCHHIRCKVKGCFFHFPRRSVIIKEVLWNCIYLYYITYVYTFLKFVICIEIWHQTKYYY